MKKLTILVLLAAVITTSCQQQQSASTTEETSSSQVLVSPNFDADSAFAFVKAQVDFGPRIPSTEAHARCAAYLLASFKKYGADVSEQNSKVSTYDGKTHQLRNIIAKFHPEKTKRVLISAHWDSRPFSDQDSDPNNQNKAFEAANDGASGVGVILEMARLIQQKSPNIGVDFILWDIEDYGKSNDQSPNETTWCLGSQHWAKNPTFGTNKPIYAINLDMVGGSNAQFTQDAVSRQYAPDIVSKVWKIADEIGYGNYFINMTSGNIIDDHFWMNQAGVKSIDIIHYSDNSGFYINWHTQLDNMNNIDRNTLKATGQTVLETIYREK